MKSTEIIDRLEIIRLIIRPDEGYSKHNNIWAMEKIDKLLVT